MSTSILDSPVKPASDEERGLWRLGTIWKAWRRPRGVLAGVWVGEDTTAGAGLPPFVPGTRRFGYWWCDQNVEVLCMPARGLGPARSDGQAYNVGMSALVSGTRLSPGQIGREHV